VYGVAVSTDGNTIVAGSTDNIIRAFGRSSNATLWNYTTGNDVYGVAVSRDGTTIAAGSNDNHFRVFARSSNTTLIDCDTGYDMSRSAAVSSDGSAIVCGNIGGVNGKVFFFNRTLGQIWNYTVGESIGSVAGSSGPSAAISADGSLSAFAGAGADGTVFVFQYDIVPPSLGSPSVLPSSPVTGQKINISISVTDNLGVSAVTLYYKNASVVSWNSTAMSLEGAVYKASIGPYSAAMNVSYYINATDTSGNFVCSPLNAPTGYYTIVVGQASTTGGGLDITTIAIIAGVTVAVVAVLAYVLTRRGKKHK
jgi:WD40 repeat protein